MKEINVLSLFSGMEVGRQATKELGWNIGKWYSSEVDKYAIKIANKNHNDLIMLGDVTKWKEWNINWKSIDLILCGSPCQGFSIAGKGLNFEDKRSKLFFAFLDILNYIKKVNPKIKFMMENVKMKKEWLETINKYLNVEAKLINSCDFSAQDRKRYYWSNFQFEEVKNKCDDVVENILEELVNSKYIINPKSAVIILENEVKKRKIAYIKTDSQGQRIYRIHGKSVTLSALGGGMGAKTGLYALPCITPERINKRQNGRRFKPNTEKFYTLTCQDTHGILTNHFIRKLTPIECERLQTLPDNYTEGVSNTQRYKMLGNGWTKDVIKHILSYVKFE